MTECLPSADGHSTIELRPTSAFLEKSASAPSTPTETSKVPHSRTAYFQPRKGRRVCFPKDDLIVTGYFDAPDPWSRVPEATNEGILSAYESACKKQNTQPFPIILEQLQKIKSFDKRCKNLNFEGLKLDLKHCEALEEIFKRMQFVHLSFEACDLDDDGAAALFDMIEYYESTKELDISFNKRINSRGWQACSRMLKKTPCIEHLKACGTPLNEQSLLILGRALRLGSHLVTLHLENCGICGRSLVVLVAAIKLNSVLKELYLCNNKISPSDGVQMGNLLRTNTWLEVLDLGGNNLQDSGIGHVLDGLCDQPECLGNGLGSLILKKNRITQSSMSVLGRCLSIKSLVTLDIGHNLITNDGVHELKQGLMDSLTLRQLELQNARITCEGAVALAEYIADSKTVRCLNLSDNDIKVAGLLALVRSMEHNSTVIRLDVDLSLGKKSEFTDECEEYQKLLKELEACCSRNSLLAEKEEKCIPKPTSCEVSKRTSSTPDDAKITTSFESYFDSDKHDLSKRWSAPSLEMTDLNSSPGSLPKSRFKVSRVFLEKESDSYKVLSSSAPAEVSSDFIRTSIENLKSSLSPVNGKITPLLNVKSEFSESSKLAEKTMVQAAYITSDSDSLWDDDSNVHQTFSEEKGFHKNSKKLFLKLPPGANRQGTIKDRRMSTPAMPVNPGLLCRPNPRKLCKHLESLDLRSSVPLSPTRLMQGWVFPEPTVETNQEVFCKERHQETL